MTEDPDVFVDTGVEYKLLNKLLIPENKDYINRLSPALFTANREDVFRAMQLSFSDYGVITYEALHEQLKGKVPGELTAANSGDIQALIKQAIRLAKKRQVKRSRELLEKAEKEYDPNIESIRTALDSDPIMADEDSSLATGSRSFLGNLHAKRSGAYTFARTGFKFADRHMGGEWSPKSVIIIMGGNGAGKTVFVGNSMKRMAQGYLNEKTGERVITPSLFISLEMSKEDLISRWIADELEIDTHDILTGDVDDTTAKAIEDKTVELQGLPMYTIDNGELTLPQIAYEIRRHVHKHNIRVAFIDYLQLMNHHPTGNDNKDLGEIAQVLKSIAKRENICIVVLSQINRGKDGLQALRDSGEVGAVACVVAQLIPDEDNNLSDTSKTVDWVWWKNRKGPSGRRTPLLLQGCYQRFIEG
jgi:archaellum biogenesis ATPase FlaH